jgi:hypothetical protein
VTTRCPFVTSQSRSSPFRLNGARAALTSSTYAKSRQAKISHPYTAALCQLIGESNKVKQNSSETHRGLLGPSLLRTDSKLKDPVHVLPQHYPNIFICYSNHPLLPRNVPLPCVLLHVVYSTISTEWISVVQPPLLYQYLLLNNINFQIVRLGRLNLTNRSHQKIILKSETVVGCSVSCRS